MPTQIYAARWVLPVAAPLIPDGEVVIEDAIIRAVRPRQSPASECRDFDNAILMPGLVNAHTHLEYTALRGFLEDIPFFPWIRALTASKTHFTPEDWLWSARLGALEAIAAGTTTLGDNADEGVTMQVLVESGLRGIVYQELFGIDPREPTEPIIAELQAKIAAHRRIVSNRVRVGVSPHALYTLRPALLAAVNAYAAQEKLPISIHVAESSDESALTERGDGAFAEMFARRGIVWETPGVTPTRYAFDQNLLHPSALAVHCVQQTEEDIALLSQSGAAVVHCPKSNAKLGAGIAPLAAWLCVPGLRIALGTDSVVSNNTLDLFEEMRFATLLQRAVNQKVENIGAKQLVEMATLGGAAALGLERQVGSLTPDKRADLIAVRLSAPHAVPATDPYAALVYAARADDVCFTLCDGVVLYDQGVWPRLDAAAILRHAGAARRKLANIPVSSREMPSAPRIWGA